MKRCRKCGMTDTRPGITFDGDVCLPCIRYENRKLIDWDARWKRLQELCEFHRGNGKDYDCIITVSGGRIQPIRFIYSRGSLE